jgi:hypothetical protein
VLQMRLRSISSVKGFKCGEGEEEKKAFD